MLTELLLLMLCAQGPALPPTLEHLAPVVGQESAFVDALRAADKLCQQRARLANARADTEERAGNATAAETLRREARESFDALRQAYEFGLHRYGANARLRTYYGELLYDRYGDAAGAVVSWTKAISLDGGNAAAYNNFGMHLCRTGQVRLGLDYMDRAVELAPKSAEFICNLSQIYLNIPEAVGGAREWKKDRVYKEAMRLLERAVRLAPGDFELLQDYAVNFFAAEQFGVTPDWTRAAAAWRQARPCARDRNEVFFTWLNEGRAWIWAGQDARAERTLAESLRRHPGNDSARTLLEGLRRGEPIR